MRLLLVKKDTYVMDYVEQVSQHHLINRMGSMNMVNYFTFLMLMGAGYVPHSTEDESTFTKGNLSSSDLIHAIFTLMTFCIMVNCLHLLLTLFES